MNLVIDENQLLLRHLLRVMAAVAIAFLINAYVINTPEFWLVLTAFLNVQVASIAPIRRGMIYLMITMLTLVVAALLLFVLAQHEIIFLVLSLLFLMVGMRLYFWPSLFQQKAFFYIISLLLILIATLYLHQNVQLVRDRFVGILVGSIIGVACRKLILPMKVEQAFSEDIQPALEAIISYTNATLLYLKTPEHVSPLKKVEIIHYPEWVYEIGFNPGVRAGYRFFLIKLEQVVELFHALNVELHEKLNDEAWNHIQKYVIKTMETNVGLLNLLINYFKSKTLIRLPSDLSEDIKQLEGVLLEWIPGNINLIDVSPSYIHLIAIGRIMKDMRLLLLDLVNALPPVDGILSNE